MSISAIITAYNSEDHLGDAIKSVLAQTLPPSELLVVDDGSTDSTAEIARSFDAVTYVHRENGGIGAARNTGVKAARGKYLAFLDSDDLWVGNKLEIQLKALKEQNKPGVFGRVKQFLCPKLSEQEAARIKFDASPQNGRSAGSMLVERQSFEQIGDFSETLKMGEFIDWVCRASDRNITFASMEEVVLLRRLHQNNYGRENVSERGNYARLLKAALDRRRASARGASE